MQHSIGTQRMCLLPCTSCEDYLISFRQDMIGSMDVRVVALRNDGRQRSSPGRESSKGRLRLKLPDPRKCWAQEWICARVLYGEILST